MAINKDKLTGAAQKLAEKGQYDKAVVEYLKIVAEDDSDYRTWLRIGDLYAKMAKPQDACNSYLKVAQHYTNQGFYLKAVAVYKQILKMNPKMVEIHQRLAELYSQLGLIADALHQYELVVASAQKSGTVDLLLSALKQIVELDPEMVSNRIKLAEIYSRENRPVEAVAEFSRAAAQLSDAGRIDDYARVAERLLFHEPNNVSFSKQLARVYVEKGDPRRALPKLQTCFKADARDTETLELLAAAFAGLGQSDKAVSVLREMARLCREGGDHDGRRAALQKIMALRPDDRDARSELFGDVPVASDAPRNSAPLSISAGLRVAISENPDYPAPGTALAGNTPPPVDESTLEPLQRIMDEVDNLIRYRQYNPAIEKLEESLRIDLSNLSVLEKLKGLYLAVGRQQDAIGTLRRMGEVADPQRQRRYMREILELDPQDVQALAQLGPSGATPRPAPDLETTPPNEFVEEIASAEFEVSESGSYDLGAEENGADLDVSMEAPEEEPAPATADEFPVVENTLQGLAPSGPLSERESTQLGSVEDELEEVEFFLQQGLLDEARTMLDRLQLRFPSHPLILNKLQEIDGTPSVTELAEAGPEDMEYAVEEDLAAELPADLPGSGEPSAGAAVVELRRDTGVGQEDYETHFDLGIAYKEMGLLDDAIVEFKVVMRDPRREAQCLIMVGLCYNDKAQYTEAIAQFKKALYVEQISDPETISLYYELGGAYEQLGDPREALYYYEKVAKRDSEFRDIQQRLRRLGGDADKKAPVDAANEDELDDALDAVIEES